MTDWRNEKQTCACGVRFTPKREKERHCSAKCGTKARPKAEARALGGGGLKWPGTCYPNFFAREELPLMHTQAPGL
jgi:hypothetical protein